MNQLKDFIDLLPVDEITLDLAAEFWAEAKNREFPTADTLSLDADMIICS